MSKNSELLAYGHAKSELWILKSVGDVADHVGLIDSDRQDLTLAVDTKDTTGLSEWSSHEDGFGTVERRKVRICCDEQESSVKTMTRT